MTKCLLVSFVLLACAACQTALLGSAKPVSAGTLSDEYARSSVAVRKKYDGKEIIVWGYTEQLPTMPQSGADQGLVFLVEKEQSTSKVICWFSREQAPGFSKIKAGQYLTVRGVFNGERGVELKFCRLIRVD